MRQIYATVAILFPLLLLAACGLLGKEEKAPGTTATPAIPTAANTPTRASTAATPEPIALASSAMTLTLWTSPDMAPRTELPGGTTLLDQLNAFDSSHPDLNLYVELKTIADQGGILSYLRSGRSIAPSILPDVILLSTHHLRDAAAQDLIYPLDDLLDEEMVNDLYPVARELAADEFLYGYPFALTNFQHLVYNSNVITATLPGNWPDLIAADRGHFIFPAAGPVGAEFTLQLYLAGGGTLLNDAGQPALQVDPLADAFRQIEQGVTANFIDVESGNTVTVEQAWQILQNQPDHIAQTTAAHFLRQQVLDGSGTYNYVPLPGPNGPLPSLVDGWTWAISTPDPARQALAAELISWLASSQNLGEWSFQSRILPARRSAFLFWPQDEPYVAFLQEQIANARPFPDGANTTLLAALNDGTSDVVLGLTTTQAAAEEAAATLLP